MSAYLTFVHALSPLHAGAGQGSGIIDLPIAREKATGLPYLPGSSLKGTLRTQCPEEFTPRGAQKKIKRVQIFGNDYNDAANASAGSIQISDQHVLLLPVRSLAGTFAWVTSPYILRRFKRDLEDLNMLKSPLTVPDVTDSGSALVGEPLKDGPSCQLLVKGKIYLEDLDLVAKGEKLVGDWATWLGEHLFPEEKDWRDMVYGNLCLVHDDIMNFLLETATEIVARIRLEESSKTVSTGALWYEEALPTETILRGLSVITPRAGAQKNGQSEPDLPALEAAFEDLANRNLSLGGKSTVGRGLCRVSTSKEKRQGEL